MTKVFYNHRMSVRTDGIDSPSHYSPSPGKPVLAVTDWISRQMPIELVESGFCHEQDIYIAHNPKYVSEVLACRRDNGFGNTDPRIAAALHYTVGSILDATMYVSSELKRGNVTAACSPTSGFHHAGYDQAHGFCTFNGLMVAAINAVDAGETVGILDCDYHFGDGTENIISALELFEDERVDSIMHWSAGEFFVDSEDADRLMHALVPTIDEMAEAGVTLILYQAGADQHVDDPLGGILTTDQLRGRDRRVFEACKERGIGVVWNLAGGYQRPINKVLEIHRNTLQECINVFG